MYVAREDEKDDSPELTIGSGTTLAISWPANQALKDISNSTKGNTSSSAIDIKVNCGFKQVWGLTDHIKALYYDEK